MTNSKNPRIIPLLTYASISLTESCNERCYYCYDKVHSKNVSKTSNKRLNNVSLEELLINLEEAGIEEVNFTGGEPFLSKTLVFDGLRYAKRLMMEVTINSNLTIPLKKEDSEKLSELGVESVLSSFPSFDQETFGKITGNRNGYLLLLQNIELLVKSKIPLIPHMVVNKDNKNQVYDTSKFIIETFGIKSFAATPVYSSLSEHFQYNLSIEEVRELYRTLINLKKEFGINVGTLHPIPPCLFSDTERDNYLMFYGGCDAGRGEIHIRPDGEVTPCPSITKSYGNIFKDNFKETVGRMKEWQYTRSGEGSVIPTSCEPCIIVEKCRGGCRSEVLAAGKELSSDSIYKHNPLDKSNLRVHYAENLITGVKIRFSDGVTLKHIGNNAQLENNGKIATLTPEEERLYGLLNKGNLPFEICQEYKLRKQQVNIFLNRLYESGIIKVVEIGE